MEGCKKCGCPAGRDWCYVCVKNATATMPSSGKTHLVYVSDINTYALVVDGAPVYRVDVIPNTSADAKLALLVAMMHNQARLEAKLDALAERLEFMPVEGAEEFESAKERFKDNTHSFAP